MPEATIVNAGAANAGGQPNSGAGGAPGAGAGSEGAAGAQGSGTAAGANSGTQQPAGNGAGGSGAGTVGDSGAAGAGGTPAGTSGADGAGAGQQPGGQTGGEPAKPAVAATWPADWRQQMAGDDKDYIKQLERFASPQDLIKKLKSQDALISSGQLKQPLPKDATPEQLAAYRKENGIPEAPDKYDLTLNNGMVIGTEDKPVLSNILTAMHTQNLTNDQVKSIVSAYYEQQGEFVKQKEIQQTNYHKESDDALRAEWGTEYRGEVNRVENLLNTFSAETQQALQFGQDAKGNRLLDNPSVLRDLAVMSRQINPVTTVVGNGGTNIATSVDTEIAQIEARFSGSKEEADKYYKDEKAQARYRELLEWRDNNKPRK